MKRSMRKINLWHISVIIIILSLPLLACSLIDDDAASSRDEAMVDSVEVVVEDSDSPDYVAVVSGTLPDSCTEIDEAEQEVEGKTIRVTLYTRKTQDAPCLDLASVPFEEEIPLDVSGLEAGSYGVEVNGAVTSFTLPEDQP